MSSTYLDVNIFEANNKRLKLVYSDHQGAWEVSVFLNEEDGCYYAKGPFARWDAICYLKLNIKSPGELQEWIRNNEKNS